MFTSAVVNQDGQPLIEGKLKEKQVRWKFIKRWKTRYFTLAGNQLLFRKGKSVSRKTVSLISLFASSPAPFPRGFYRSALPVVSVRCVANFSHGVAHQLELYFSLWIKSVRFLRVLSIRLALLLFSQQMPGAQHCDLGIYTLLAGDLCPSIVPSARGIPRSPLGYCESFCS